MNNEITGVHVYLPDILFEALFIQQTISSAVFFGLSRPSTAAASSLSIHHISLASIQKLDLSRIKLNSIVTKRYLYRPVAVMNVVNSCDFTASGTFQ